MFPENDFASDAIEIANWSEKNEVLRSILDHVWQGWGEARCQHLDERGELILFNPQGDRVTASSTR